MDIVDISALAGKQTTCRGIDRVLATPLDGYDEAADVENGNASEAGVPTRVIVATEIAKESWRGEDVTKRLRYIEEDLIMVYPAITRALKEIRRRYRRAVAVGKGDALLVICPTGGGKSTLVRLLQKSMPVERAADKLALPVVGFSVPPTPSPSTMPQQLLKAMGDGFWMGGNALVSMHRATHLLNQCEARIVAIDNMQDIPERRGKKGVLLVGNWIRDLWDAGSRLVLMLGTQAAEEVVDANPQLRRRGCAKLHIPYFTIHTKQGRKVFERFLQELDKAMPLAELSSLDKWLDPIFFATCGIQDYIFKLIAEAISAAVESKRESIIKADLAQAFDLVFCDAGGALNPFRDGGAKRLLDRAGEPFFNWEGLEISSAGGTKREHAGGVASK